MLIRSELTIRIAWNSPPTKKSTEKFSSRGSSTESSTHPEIAGKTIKKAIILDAIE
jgi:hypothetical protein